MNVSGWTSVDNNDTITVSGNRSTKSSMPLMLASPPVELYYYHLVFLSAAIALGVPGNLLVIIVYSAVPRKIACDWYILYIGGLDLIVCLFRVPTHLAMETGYWQRHSSSSLCRLVYWLSQSVITASVILFGFIAVDRYIKICRTNVQLSLRFCLGCVAVISVGSMVSALPTIWIYSSSVQGLCVTSSTLLGETLTRAYYSFIFVVFILMFLVVVSCYTLIIVKVRMSRKILKAHGVRDVGPQSTARGKSLAKRRENRVGVATDGNEGQACGTKRSSLDFDCSRNTPWVTRSSLTSVPQKVQDKELLWTGADEQTTDGVHLHTHREPATGIDMAAESREYDLNRSPNNIVGHVDVAGLSHSVQSPASVAGAPPTKRGSIEDKDLTTGTEVVHVITVDSSQTAGQGPTSAEAGGHVTRSRGDIKCLPCFRVAPDSEVSDYPTLSAPSASCVDNEVTNGKGRHGHIAKVTTSNGGHSSRNLRLTLLLLIMTILFVVSWIPPYVAMVWYFYVGYTPPFSSSDLSVMTYAPTGYILNHFANPFVYLIFSSSFRKHLVYLWRKLKNFLC
ncbi:uncharacterized protein LOC112561599 isoform X2 [Pomacea canaliculata]|nr:uncharacterized protein LOC112561599 isoform X2 [Pomacea canaliculata]XP_025089958.1 uncharacterized protein LOC112561599 isoform X2 [Pomacea canaliculata]